MKRNFRIILLTILSFFSLFIITQFLPNERKKLIKDINNLKKAVEKEDINQTLDYLDQDYFDQHYLNFDGLRNTIQEFFKTADSINIIISGLKVRIDSTKNDIIYAHCSLGLRVIAKYENEKVLVFGGVIQPASVKGYFRKQKGNYRIYSAEY